MALYSGEVDNIINETEYGAQVMVAVLLITRFTKEGKIQKNG